MNLKNFKITNKGLYWGLILTFGILYLCVGFVSTLHSITFFSLANNLGLAILLGLTYEIGQASVLFSILLTKNKDKFLPWALMFLLTALQVTANVYASFKFMIGSGSTDWQYWQKSILFGIQASSPEMYQVIISWISGALLPIVALGMTALVAQNIKLATEEKEQVDNNKTKKIDENILKPEISNELPEKNEQKFEPKFTKSIEEINEDIKEIENSNTIDLSEFKSSKIVTEIEPKKGRPPKQQVETVAELKKEQEPLLIEEVKVPEKQKRFVNPLKLKGKKIKPVKNLKEFHKESTGDKIIQIIKNIDKEKDKESNITDVSLNLDVSEPIQTLSKPQYGSYILNGVEVVDVQSIPNLEEKKIIGKIDKFGIPIKPNEQLNFDRI